MTSFDHIEELRWHIIRSFVVCVVLTIAIFCTSDIVFNKVLFGPLHTDFWSYRLLCSYLEDFCVKEIPVKLINTELGGQFILHLETSFTLGLMGTVPYFLWEMWRFISPALYHKERSYAQMLLVIGFFLFIVGVLFGYFIVFPLSVLFLTQYEISSTITNMPNISNYFENLSSTVLWSGLIFELPVICYFLAKMGVLTATFMRNYRKHLYVAILILAGAITPSPDIWSQIMVTIPLILLYEVSILVVMRVEFLFKKQEAEENYESL